MGYQVNSEDTRKMLACFFGTCAEKFLFLERDHGFERVDGVANYLSGRTIIKPYSSGSVIDGDAVILYEKKNAGFEVLYNRDCLLDSFIIFDRAHRIPFRDYVSAVRKTFFFEKDAVRILSAEEMANEINTLAAMLRKHKDLLLERNPKHLERVLTIRETLMEQKIRAQYRREIRRVSEEGARAFMEKDYPRVIQLYLPYERDLSAACLKKLELARAKIISQVL